SSQADDRASAPRSPDQAHNACSAEACHHLVAANFPQAVSNEGCRLIHVEEQLRVLVQRASPTDDFVLKFSDPTDDWHCTFLFRGKTKLTGDVQLSCHFDDICFRYQRDCHGNRQYGQRRSAPRATGLQQMKFNVLRRPVLARFLIATVLLLSMFGASAKAGPYLLLDVGSGRVLAQENAFQRWYPASLTKLMTAYVAFRMIQNGDASMQTPVRISQTAAKLPPAKMGYPIGSMLTLETALNIIMVKSANDVATAIGESLAGSESVFAAWMNAGAGRRGRKDSHRVNAHGRHSRGQYTSVHELALLVRAIRVEFPQYASLFSIEGIISGNTKMPNGNLLVGRFAGTDGMKTGYICASGFNLISTATRNGRTLAAIVLGSLSQVE